MIPRIENPVKQAHVIKISGRYFSKFGKKGQVQTAWTIAGAKLFVCCLKLQEALSMLDSKEMKYIVKHVEVNEHSGLTLRDFYFLSYRLRRMTKNAGMVGKKIGYQDMAHQISLMSAALVLMEKEHSRRNLSAISENISKTTTPWSCGFELTIADRLKIYKSNKKGGVNIEFYWDVPF
ncbi:hypothetical protein BBN02_21585 [Vibrio parahaemolyticus]|uniref:hypothetical protein n=1 Tax=Vibrio parahaemolyticus TaxID=670 RepID=UPI00084A4F2B|nr:hypothetical protein [Vibrio parahaemolyticus]ODZ31786.1 hypothetical protein BBN02_21585 [Vibrio parahaemolyticus]